MQYITLARLRQGIIPNLFELILDGKADYRLVGTLTSYMEYIRPLVDAAVLDGVLPAGALG